MKMASLMFDKEVRAAIETVRVFAFQQVYSRKKLMADDG